MTPAEPGIVIGPEPRHAIAGHATRTYPEECCGVLIGLETAGRKTVLSAIPIVNARNDSARNRYRMDGEAIRRAAADAARDGAEIVGWYHSHPDVPAVPSKTDRDEATWPFYSYVIASVQDGVAREMRSWKLTEDRSEMVEEPILEDA